MKRRRNHAVALRRNIAAVYPTGIIRTSKSRPLRRPITNVETVLVRLILALVDSVEILPAL